MEQKEKKESGFYYRFFNESDTAMAVLNREGMILTTNKKFDIFLESLCLSSEKTVSSKGRTKRPRFIQEIPDPQHVPEFWSSLMPVIKGEKNHVVFKCTFNLQKNTQASTNTASVEIDGPSRNGDNDIPHWFNAHAWRIEDVPQGGNLGTKIRLISYPKINIEENIGRGQSGNPQETMESQGLLNRSNTFRKGWLIGLVLDDYSQARQEEKKLLLGKEIAEKAMEAKDQFLANMSHEIRTPIQTIIGMTELLQETSLDREQTEYSRQVKFSAEVLLTLINDILDYSKIEAGKMELEQIDFDLEQVIEQAVDMIAMEAHKKGLYIATNIPLEINIIAIGDPSKFRQVVINLVKNAVKFTREGGVTVSLEMKTLSGREAVRVSVADTGIGVNEETRPRLFSTFMQADVSNTRRFGGTGLGLAISNNLVHLMKGRIEMVPNEGEGSIFRFDIPLERSAKEPDPLPQPERNGKLKILIVDDRAEECNILDSRLRELGYTDITRAESGQAALKMMKAAAARDKAYQLCFLDMIMPVMDGWRLAAEIHNDTEINQSDLILMVPHGLMGAETKMTLLKWFKAYINKPIKRRNLAETICQVLNEPQELEDVTVLEEQVEDEELDRHISDIPVIQEDGDMTIGEVPLQSPLTNRAPLNSLLPILIAEDHPVNQKLFSMILDKLGYSTILADDGLDALEKEAANEVALIFMDIQMPRMNGYEAVENLRKRGFKKPIIAITASALSDEREHCFKVGIDDVLVKPFKRADIEMVLQKWLKAKEKSPATPAPIPVEEPDTANSRGPEETGVNQETVFSAEDVMDTFMNNIEMIMVLLPRFIERTQAQLKNIPELEKAGDFAAARIEAHTIKGAASTMSGKELAKAAACLELACKNSEKDEVKSAYPSLIEAFNRFKKEAEDFLRTQN